MDQKVLKALRETAAVPSMPQVVVRFLEVIQDPSFTFEDIAKTLSVDPGITSDLLRLTNSALFGLRNKVKDLRQAVTLLGPKRTRSLVLGRYLTASMGEKVIPGLDLGYYWRRSLTCSVLAARIADVVLPSRRDDAFLSGLLADIGIPILAEAFPDQYLPIARRFCVGVSGFDHDQELRAVAIHHAELAAVVLSDWGLPENICAAVRQHHDPLSENASASLSVILAVADQIAQVLCVPSPQPEEVAEACVRASLPLALSPAASYGVLEALHSDLEELAETLHIDIVSAESCRKAAESVQNKLAILAEA